MAEYEFEIKDVEPRPCLYVRREVKLEAVKDFFSEALPAVHRFMQERGIGFGGPPFGRYLSCLEDGGFQMDAGVQSAGPAEGEGPIEAGVLAGGKALVYTHAGTYEKLGEAWQAGDAYMAEEGLEAGEPPYEIYLTDPRELPDPADWRTLIVRPLKS